MRNRAESPNAIRPAETTAATFLLLVSLLLATGWGVPEILYVPTPGDGLGIGTGLNNAVLVAGGADTVGAAVNGASIFGL